MNKEEILVSAEVKTFLHDLYSQIEYELQEQYKDEVQKLTQENNDLEERVIHQDNLIKGLQEEIEHLKQPQIFIDTEDMEERYGNDLYVEYLEKEKKHLESAIEELEKWLKEMLDSENDIFSVIRVKDVLDKLNELRSKE